MTEGMPPQVRRRPPALQQKKRWRFFENTVSRPRRCCFEQVSQIMGLRQRRMKSVASRCIDYAAEAMNDSAFGLHLAGQINPRDVGMYFYALNVRYVLEG